MRTIALTGGIGSGKSTVAKMFARLGAETVDADELARSAVAVGSRGLEKVAAAFGKEVLLDAGDLDRKRLGEIVFANFTAKKTLENIVHPEIKKLFAAKKQAALSAGAAVLIYEIPLLVESGQAGNFDGVIAVLADATVRQQRLTANRGLTSTEAAARIAAQASEKERLAVADWVVKTDVAQNETERQVRKIWQEITAEDSAAASIKNV